MIYYKTFTRASVSSSDYVFFSSSRLSCFIAFVAGHRELLLVTYIIVVVLQIAVLRKRIYYHCLGCARFCYSPTRPVRSRHINNNAMIITITFTRLCVTVAALATYSRIICICNIANILHVYYTLLYGGRRV